VCVSVFRSSRHKGAKRSEPNKREETQKKKKKSTKARSNRCRIEIVVNDLMAVVKCLVPQILTRHNSRSNSWKLGLLKSGVEVFLRGERGKGEGRERTDG
jgi:4-diphosphocytidyl-2C-methyl-D-erythritol kinase